MASSPSPSSSRSSRSSEPPEPQIAAKNTSKKSKDKGKKQANNQIQGKNEGISVNWAYKPPPGSVLIENNDDAGDFDWDAINDNANLDLWLIRVPESIKPKYFENITISPPSSSKSAKVGTMKRKLATFDIWSLGEDEDDHQPIGGEEIKSLTCLLPRKSKKGRLYAAPRPVARHLVVTAQQVTSTLESPNSPLQRDPITGKYKNPLRHSYPDELLKHEFKPYGSHTAADVEDVPMEVDDAPPPPAQPPTKKKSATTDNSIVEKETKKSKGRKRKGDAVDEAVDSPVPKKSKKAKTTS